MLDGTTHLPHHIRVQWEAYKASLHKIEEIQIRRCISPAASKRITLHGFGDASEKAYAAAVYVKAEQSQGSPVISLVAAKTKVAPVKTVTLPRLELCGAVLVTKLLKTVQESLKMKIE